MKPTSTAAFLTEFYVVDPHRPEPTAFRDRAEAERVARAAVRRLGPVRLYLVIGEPVTDLWRLPVLIGEWGR